MGLDGVELVLATEESFGITIADEEAEKVITVGDLYQLILSKIGPAHQGKCITASAFYALRSIIANHLNLDCRVILRDTRLDEIIPLDGRKVFWSTISKDADLILPSLTRNTALNYALFIIPTVSILYFILGLVLDVINDLNATITACIGIVLTYILVKITEPLKVHFTQDSATMGLLTSNVVANNFSKLSNDCREWTESDVYQTTLELISVQLGIEKSKIELGHSFIDDLGMN